MLKPKKKKMKKSLMDLGGIAKSRKIGAGNEREYTKKIIAEKIYKEIVEEDKKLCEDFLSISLETMDSLTRKRIRNRLREGGDDD